MNIELSSHKLLCLMQLASPALPVGAYTYSDGLETLVEKGIISDRHSLKHWLEQELSYGAVRIDAAVMLRAYKFTQLDDDIAGLNYWNNWLSAFRETEELRLSSWQMGRSLLRLLVNLEPTLQPTLSSLIDGNACNWAIAFGIAAGYWQIDLTATLLAYLHSWATNLVAVGVKLIPLGQTVGQNLLLNLQSNIQKATTEIPTLEDDELSSCSWGLSLASMAHETQYSRLFRS